ncbi:hypothetical protein AA313_de0205857 [Arthrobotrys entomopaga]|nr:hypothetical protein AA313_de0205857 [Arthrobotrys entomopaga]
MASNYYAYGYGNLPYSQTQQSAQDQDASSNASHQHQLSQNYYTGVPARQASQDSRATTTQYNGLHFPAPAPARQPTTSAHRIAAAHSSASSASGSGRDADKAGKSSNYGVGGVVPPGYQSQGSYHQATKTGASQSAPHSAGTTPRTQDRTEYALSAATNWTAGADAASMPRQTAAASRAESSADYNYSYRQTGTSSAQSSYYAAQRQPNVSASSQQVALSESGYDQNTAYTSSAAQQPSSKAPQPASQKYQKSTQNTSTSYGNRYDSTATRNDTLAAASSTYQQGADYGKPYQDDADRDHNSLRNAYALPQPIPNRNTTGISNSYFSQNPAAETSYAPTTSSQSPKLNSGYQKGYERATQNAGEGSTSVTSMSTFDYSASAAPPPSQAYYPTYSSSEAISQAGAYYGGVPATVSTSSQPLAAPAPTTTTITTKPKKPRQTQSQKPAAAKTPKPRAPRKPKASATTSTVTPIELPKQHTFHPAVGNSSLPAPINTNNDDIGMTRAPQSKSAEGVPEPSGSASGQPLSASSSSSAAVLDMASMEQHMREMVEKMREYQSKDPTAFQQVWENVKRSGPGAGAVKPGTLPVMPATTSASGATSPKSSKPVKTAKNTAQPAKHSTPSVTEGRSTPAPGSAASQAQKTVWPATQKVPLSRTTSKFFKNLGQSCPESFALGLLDYGPSFPELCQKLENHGYKFERNKFAIELLKTTDAIQNSSSKTTTSHSIPAISAVAPIAPSAATGSLETSSRALTPQSVKSFNPRNIKDSIPTFLPSNNLHDQPQNFVAPSMIYREVYPTVISQSESNIRADQPSMSPTPVAEDVRPVLEKPVAKASVKKRVSMVDISKQNLPKAPLPSQPPQVPTILTQPQAPVAPQMPREEIMTDAGPLPSLPSNRLEGLYDQSILASPPIPSNDSQASPVNELLQSRLSKLEAQIMRLKEIESPSQPPPAVVLPSSKPAPSHPPLPLPPPPIRKPQLPRPPALDRKKALRRNTYDPQNIVHGVLLATGRHPNYEGLNSGLAILKRLHPEVFDNSVDLARIPWDLYDPPPAPLPGEERKGKRNVMANEEEFRGRKRDPVPFTPGVRRTETDPSTPVSADGQVLGKRGRPRGRPRGARGGRGGALSAREGLINEHAGSSGDSSTQANSQKYSVARVNIHSLNRGGGSNGGDGSGRKRKYGDSPHSRQPSGSDRWGNGLPQLIPVFKCQWEKCNHELQNLDTLRKHLLKKHKVENNMGVMPCCWGDCGQLIPVESLDPKTGKKVIESRRKRLNFGTGAAWDDHVLGRHLKLVKEELGEGMSIQEARSLSRESSAHSVEGRIRSMSRDRRGHSVTPVITPAPYGYKFTPPPGFSAGSQFRHAHDFNNDLPNEKKLLEDALARIEQIGSGMETLGLNIIPGVEYDSAAGYLMKVRKLTEDLDLLPPHPPIKKEQDARQSSLKGKERAL